ncbi:putative glucose-6-phosphate 1-epimerase [Neltuma alba]|uniref:putative glucose-6-phosphate 1-epimerase n=1 Tax=Neltuma alba TaxID=207710 RepID=UPI0010A2D4A4|nr:putative glucose-6-phosphate 1-epimerase [Prosopis alba]
MASGSSSEAEIVYVEQCKGTNGLDKIVLREKSGHSAEVYLFGGQVTSWTTNRGEELIFVSKKADFKPPNPIRGGIQMCFPEFTFQNREKYGFARNKLWTLDPTPELPSDDTHKAFTDLILKYSEQDRWDLPHKYEYRLRVILGPDGNLTLISRIRNINLNGKPFTFSFAYNAHFCVSDVWDVRVEGFETYDYLDNLKNRERFTEQGNALTFEEEVDRVYLDIPQKIAIIDHEKKRTYVLRQEGLTDAGVWNPWDKKAKALADFGNEEYLKMVCVRPARIMEKGKRGVTIKPGEEWRGKLEISLVNSSYHSGQLDPLEAIKSSGASSSSASKPGGAGTSSSSPSKAGPSRALSISSSPSKAGPSRALSISSSPSKAGPSRALSISSSPSKAGTSRALSISSSPSKAGTSRALSISSSPSKGGTSRAISSSSSPSKGGTSRAISSSPSPSKAGTSSTISSSSSPSKGGTSGAKSSDAFKAGRASSSSPSPSKAGTSSTIPSSSSPSKGGTSGAKTSDASKAGGASSSSSSPSKLGTSRASSSSSPASKAGTTGGRSSSS